MKTKTKDILWGVLLSCIVDMILSAVVYRDVKKSLPYKVMGAILGAAMSF